ncbi:EPIDERMAL PATTERNING FACTOR-like protein 5 [Physcomitrium patens]|uniref:Epidermal patterning factor-like protein n=1 Tax=Physcomitrium patens TaxID=3218 RepID=A0A2K1L1C9_PHYPA|nr:EPIDERMAL PATTERNING FACTOR-like protein 1 [Physcomitrium patens]PNR59834.1 hypothetical protein PHYPA_002626 [Physcomitrium patens]|eukprot:XP_024358169.1 EPIDERMAL PATTERNING FACTOR-like protein 1 [Physcomitrella patens]
MPTLSCRILLFLTMVPYLAAAGRPIPAPPLIASSTTTPQVKLTWGLTSGEDLGIAELTWKYGSQYQDSSPPSPRVASFRGNVKKIYRDGSIFGHRILLGSAPPSCQGKCGLCVPCNPIHFSLGGPHGSISQQEYYPEVWRCKCGNHFFMP